MSDSRTYTNVTEQIFACVKQKSHDQHGTVYDPPDGDSGTATTKIKIIGTVQLSFDLDPTTSSITYTLMKKPRLAPEGKVWGGIESTIQACQSA